jgi:transcriptional regulator with XRE-family HTH domain
MHPGRIESPDPVETAGQEIALDALIVDPPHNYLGTVIRAYRSARDISQQQLSAEVGISVTHLSEIERGKTKPSYQIVLDVLKKLGVDPQVVQALIEHLKASHRTLDHLLLQEGWDEHDRTHILQLPLGTRQRLVRVLLDRNGAGSANGYGDLHGRAPQ